MDDLRNDSISKLERIMASMVLFFPTIYLWFSIIGKNNNMRVFYFVYCFIIFLLMILNHKVRISKELATLIGLLLIKLVFDSMAFPDSLSDAIEFGVLLLVLDIIQKKEVRRKYYFFLLTNQRRVLLAYILYILGVAVTFIIGIGITNRWGTISVQGPYGLAHIFAYELLVLSVNSFLLWNHDKKIRWLLFLFVFLVLTVLTNVRTVLLAVVVATSYFLIVKNGIRKIVYVFLALVVGYTVFRFTPLFSFVIQKTVNAINNGSITNYRYEIWFSSLQFFVLQPIHRKLLGAGINSLLAWNAKNVRMLVQAHNDFITVLDAFGILSLGCYFWYLAKASRKGGGTGFFIFLLVLIIFNGLYSYCSFVIGLVSIRLLFEKLADRSY